MEMDVYKRGDVRERNRCVYDVLERIKYNHSGVENVWCCRKKRKMVQGCTKTTLFGAYLFLFVCNSTI
jgi:hypothetical protein